MRFINDLKLKFDVQELEEKYQMEKAIEIKKPVFLFILFLSLCSNIPVLALHFFNRTAETWYINLMLIIFSVIQAIVILVFKQLQYIQIGLTFSSIAIGILQLNVDPLNTTQNEFYAYGQIFMQFQAVLFMVSNFDHAFFQVISSLAIRTTITTIYSHKPDYLSIFVGLFGCILILIAVYVNDKNARRYFVQNLKENNLKKLGKFLLNKPYLRIQYYEDQKIFQLLSQTQIEKFPGYNPEECHGCNIRNMLRSYKSDKGNLEQILLNQPDLIKFGCILMAKWEKIRFLIKVCLIDPQHRQYLIIFQEYHQEIVKVLQQEKEQKQLKEFLKQNQIYYHQKVFNLGAFSVLLLNKQVIKRFEFVQILEKIVRIYQVKFFPNIEIEIQTKDNTLYICQYLNQLRIFLVQIFEIISEITLTEKEKVFIHLQPSINNIELKIKGLNQQLFEQKFDQNYFVSRIKSLLLDDCQFYENESIFLIINYPLGTYLYKQS